MALSCALHQSDCIWIIMIISNLSFYIRKLWAAKISKLKSQKDNKNRLISFLVFTGSKCLFLAWVPDGWIKKGRLGRRSRKYDNKEELRTNKSMKEITRNRNYSCLFMYSWNLMSAWRKEGCCYSRKEH